MICIKHVCESEEACYIEFMKIFLLALSLTGLFAGNVAAGDLKISAGVPRVQSHAVSKSPRAYVQDHHKLHVPRPHRYKNWRYNYSHRPDRYHTSYGWQEHRPVRYPYAQSYYSSPNVIVRETIRTPVIVSTPAPQGRAALPWRGEEHFVRPNHRVQPPYIEREIIHTPQQHRETISRDPLNGLWNAIGLGYE